MNITAILRSYLLYAVFPDKCVCCGRIVARGESICPVCAAHLERFEYEKRCVTCGLIKKRCRCRKQAYHFSGIIAPFYNEGLAKRGFYRYKLGHKERLAEFFAAEMTESIKREYTALKFDGVCAVPPSRKRMRKYGYNPPDQMGRIIAERLGVPFIEGALGCGNAKSSQHKSGRDERFSSVRGRYFSRRSLNNKTVLLVDDITTTGATLDECARQLLKGGADEVWCVTALITDNGYKCKSGYTAEILRQDGIAIEK